MSAVKRKAWLLLLTAGVTVLILSPIRHPVAAKGDVSMGLTGQVRSQEEGPMEGVVVTAKQDASTISVSVVSDKAGRYSFPANRLAPGHYSLRIRAVGYDLDSPGSADLTGQKITTADLRLRKTNNMAPQLTNAEWLMSAPGNEQEKSDLLHCIGCHTLARPLGSTHDADEFTQVIARMMSYASGSQPIRPQRRMNPERVGNPEKFRPQAQYLASINLSTNSKWEYRFQTLPRPTGRATRVIITEYDLPRRTIMPHDVVVDEHGLVWYSDFGEQYFGRLDPKTGKVTEWPVPELKPGYPQGLLDVQEDKDGNFWLGNMFQGGVAKFDPKTEKFKMYKLPDEFDDKGAQLNMVSTRFDVDGKVWIQNDENGEIYRLDLETEKFEKFQPLKQLPGKGPYSIYEIAPDSHNNLYFTEFQTNYLGRIDAKTGEVKFFPTPTLHSQPRRMVMDSQERIWFAEFNANRVGLFDTKTEKFTEWLLPIPWTAPYYAVPDKNGDVWTGGMTTDRAVRLDPKTGKTVEYLLPSDTNMRRVFVDNSTTPVTFWVGSNHGAAIAKVEPLD